MATDLHTWGKKEIDIISDGSSDFFGNVTRERSDSIGQGSTQSRKSSLSDLFKKGLKNKLMQSAHSMLRVSSGS